MGVCGRCDSILHTGLHPLNPILSCVACKRDLCPNCVAFFFVEKNVFRNVNYCVDHCYKELQGIHCVEALVEKEVTGSADEIEIQGNRKNKRKKNKMTEKLKVGDYVTLNWLNNKLYNSLIGEVCELANSELRFQIKILRSCRDEQRSLVGKLAGIKNFNLVKLHKTIFYHFGIRNCSFCGAECDCGASETMFKKDEIPFYQHSDGCHHYINTLRRKGPDCSNCYWFGWSCCDIPYTTNERVASHGCMMGRSDQELQMYPNNRIYPGDPLLRFDNTGRPQSDEARIKAALDIQLEATRLDQEDFMKSVQNLAI